MARKTNTPKWLSLIREIMIYVGGSSVLITTMHKLGIKDTEFGVQVFMTALAILQFYNRIYFRAEKPEGFKPETNKIKD